HQRSSWLSSDWPMIPNFGCDWERRDVLTWKSIWRSRRSSIGMSRRIAGRWRPEVGDTPGTRACHCTPSAPGGMLVSLVIPMKNEETTLPTLIQSIGQQTRPPDEVALVDGGSSDGTVRL